jgi:hypothetical protein
VGNSPLGFVGVVKEPSGSVPPGREKPGRLGNDEEDSPSPSVEDDEGEGVAVFVTVTVESAWTDAAPVAAAVAVRMTRVPFAAAEVTPEPATISVACPIGRLSRVHRAPSGDGHTP